MAAIEWEQPVAAAIAAKILAVSGMKAAATFADENLPKLPGALVLMPDIEQLERSGVHHLWRAIFPVELIPETLKSQAETDASLVSLVGRIRIAWLTGHKLGLAYVSDSQISSAEPDLFKVGGEEQLAYRLTIAVDVRESLTRTA